MRYTTTVLALAGACLLPRAAQAGTVGAVMPVTAITLNACAVTATPLVFGTLNQLNGSANDSQTTVVVNCTPGTQFDVGMDNGAHAVAGVRHMTPTLGSASIPYVLYTNASRTSPWGATVGSNTVSGTAAALPTTLTVYGRVPAGMTPVAADAYADAVTVTVTF